MDLPCCWLVKPVGSGELSGPRSHRCMLIQLCTSIMNKKNEHLTAGIISSCGFPRYVTVVVERSTYSGDGVEPVVQETKVQLKD